MFVVYTSSNLSKNYMWELGEERRKLGVEGSE